MRNSSKKKNKPRISKATKRNRGRRPVKRGSKKSQHATSLQAEFLAKLSHELRTLLNAIIGFSELIYNEKSGSINDEQREYLNDILASAKSMLRLIKNVSNLPKMKSGLLTFHPKKVNLKQKKSQS